MGLIYTPQDFHKVFHIYKQFRASHKNDGRPQDGIGYNCSAWISIFYHQRMFIISFVTFYSAHPYYNLSLLLPFTKCCWIICTLFFQVPKSSKQAIINYGICQTSASLMMSLRTTTVGDIVLERELLHHIQMYRYQRASYQGVFLVIFLGWA